MMVRKDSAVTLYSKEVKHKIADLAFAEYAARRVQYGSDAKAPSESEIGIKLVLFALAEMERQGKTRLP